MKKTIALFLSLVLMLQPVLGSAAFALPSALKAIQAEAFAGNKSITGNLELPDNVRSVGDRAFADTDVFALWLPAATTSVGSSILAGADTAYVVVENATASLADSAFDDVEILFGKGNSTAQRYAEKHDLGFFELENTHWYDGFAYYNHGEYLELVTGASEHSGSVTIPQSVSGYPVTAVSGYAFMDQDGITSISLPDTVEANMPEEESRSNWPSSSISFYSTGVDPVIPPEADPENGGYVMELDIFPSSVTLMPGETFIPILEGLPEAEYIFSSYSTDESVVAVSETLDAFAVAPGSAAFTVVAVPSENGEATASELGVTAYYGTVQIRVAEPEISIDLFESTVNMTAGQAYYPRLEIKTPSTIFQPELDAVSADPAIADAYFVGSELMLEAKGEGKTTIAVTAVVPAYGDYEAVTATAEIKVNVSPAAFETTYTTLYTYAGLEHDFDVISELEEGDEVSFAVINDLITYNEETARVIVGDQAGESAVVVTVTHAEGTQESVTVPVYIKPFLSFGEPNHRDDLNPGWEYHYEWQNLMPDLSYDLWAHDSGLIYTYAEAADEQLSIENEMTEGKPVIIFDEDEDGAGNIWVRSIAQYPGSASVTYYATLNTDILPDTVHVPVVASEPVQITVQPADIVAHLDEEVYHIYGDELLGLGYWYDGPFYAQHENFTSSDESIFTINAPGSLIPHNPGEATLTYTVWSFGTAATAEATVYVHGGSIDLSPAEATVRVGEQITLVPVLPEGVNGTYYDFFPADDTIATVNELGVVTGLRAGSTEILYRTTIDDVDLWARSLIHVVDEEARLNLNTTSVSLYEGETFQLEAIYADGDEPVSIKWASTWAPAVSVDENGMITPIMQDWAYPNYETITCTATFGDGSVETATCQVYAEEQIVRMYDDWGHYRLEVGQTQEFYGTASIAGNYTLSDFDVSYVSDNEEIVTVDETGLMTALAEGTAKVYVIYELDGRCVFRNFSFVHVGTPYPTLDDCTLTFNTDHFFVLAPENGEPILADVGYEFSDPDMWHYYWDELSILNAEPEGSIVLTDNGIEVYGEGTAELFITAVPHDEGIDVPEGFGDTAKLTAGVPRLRYDVTSFSGEEKETVFDEETGLPIVELGDIVTVTLEGVPEDIAHRHIEWNHDYHAFREIARTDRTLTLQAQRAGSTHLYMGADLECNAWIEVESGLHVAGDEDSLSMGEPSVVMAVGESIEIHPGFPDWEDGSFTAVAAWAQDGSEADASEIIAIGEEFPTITAVAPGRVKLLASVMLYGEKLELPVYVTVVESEWYFNIWDCEDIMFVGQGYDPCIDVVYTGYHYPQITFSFSDPSLMEMNYDDWCLIPLAAGDVTITATIEKDGRTETITKDVTIIEPSLSFKDGPHMQLAPNERRILTLVNNTGKEIKSVSWAASHSNHALLDIEENSPTSILVIAGGNYTNDWFFSLITATVTFADGTTDVVSARIGVQPAHEIWPEASVHEHYFELSPGETAEIPYDLDWNTISLSFTSENPEVATVSANGIVTAVNPGETEIVVRFGTYSDNVREERVTIVVKNFKATLTPSALSLHPGESAYVVPTVDLGDSGYWINDQRTGFWSMDDSVASVDHLGLVTAKAPGSTVVVYEAYTFYDDHRLIAYCPVTVTAGEGGLTLSETEISLRPREEFQLSVTVNGNLESDIAWTSSAPDVIAVTDNGFVKLRTWDVFEAVQTGAIYATATVDGVETTAVCKVNFLPAAVFLYNAPNFYEIGVGERALVEYAVTVNDPSIYYTASFESTDEDIMIVDQNGVMTGISEGVCMVRLNLTDETGRLLCSGAAYVYVGTPLPTPADEGAAIDFEADHYYMTLDEEMGKHRSAFIIDPAELGIYYNFHIESDNEDIVICHGGDHIEAVGEGTTTIRAWFEGFEEYAATATVTVGNPYLTFDKPLDENGCPIVAAGDTVTVTLHGMPTFGDMDPTTQIKPQFVNIHADLNGLREVSRGVDEEGRNTFTFIKLGDHGTEANIEVCLECGWWNSFDFYVCIEETENEFRMNESALVMAIGEEVNVWPEFDWKEYVSVSSSNEDAVTVDLTDEGDLHLTAVGLGDAVITAELLLDDDSTVTAETKVHSVKAFWRLVHLDHIDESMKVGQHFELNPHIVISGYHYPEIVWESSDPSILSVETFENDWDWHAVPKAPGVATLTCYATMNGETQSMSKDVTVTEPRVYFTDLEPEIRPNQTKFIPLVIVNDTDEKIVENITYYSEDAGLVSVEDGLLEYGSPAAKITCVKPNNSTRIFAVVEFKDGSVATAACRVWPLDNGGIWIDAHTDNLWLNTEEWGEEPTVDILSLWWETNAALNSDPNNTGSDTAWVEWHIEDENVARIIDNSDPEQNNVPIIAAIGEGETAIYATIRVYDAEGNEIASDEVERRIYVRKPHFEVRPKQDTYYLEKIDGKYMTHVDWIYDEHGVGNVTAEVFYSDDSSIVFCDQFGNILAENSGETDVHIDVYINGHYVTTGTAHVVVTGSNVVFWQDGATLNEGESLQLIVYPQLRSDAEFTLTFTSDNEAVARVNENGLLYAVAPGRAMIACWLETADGYVDEAQFFVTVTGEASDFALSTSTLKLYPGASYTLTDDLSGYDSVSWNIEGHENIFFDAETQTVSASHNDEGKTYTAVITCTVVKDGVSYTANCHVALLSLTLDICNRQFGDGAWHTIHVGDRLNIWETYLITDPSVEVTVDIWTDDENIAFYNPDINAFEGRAVGDTTAYYKVTGSNGETHTASAMLRVIEDESDVWPERIDALHADHAFVVNLHDGERGFPFVTTPQYTSMEMYFISGDDNILSFSGEANDGRMFLRGVGRTTVTIEPGEFAPEGLESAQGEVLVLDPERIVLAPVDENGNPIYDLPMGQTYQLTFTAVDGGILWDENDIESITYDSFWNSENNLLLSETGELNVISAWADSLWAAATVTFKDGSEMGFTYDFHPVLAENQAYFTMHGEPLSRLVMPVNSYHDNAALVYSNEHIVNFTPNSTDASIAEFVWNEDWNAYAVKTYSKTGEATLTGTATLESGETVTASMQVVVRAGEAPDVTMEASKSLLTIGEEVFFGISSGNGFTIHPNVDTWMSSDESILAPKYDAEGNPIYDGNFVAVGLGEATVTAVAHYGGVYSNLTCTVHVSDYPVAYLDESHVDLRPDEKHQLILMENEFSTKDIASVQWSIDDDSIASFTPFEGNRSVILTGVAKSGDTVIRATVTDTDGSVTEYAATIHITTNDEVWVDPWHDEVWLSTESWGVDPVRAPVWQSWNHNASHFDEIGRGSDKAWIEWEIEDENIVVFDGFYELQEGDLSYGQLTHAPWNNGPMVKAVSAGNTVIKTHLVLTDKDGNFLAECRDEIPVHVIAPTVNVYAEHDTYEVQVGRSEWVNWRVDGENIRNETSSKLYTDDPSIAVFNMYGDIVGVKPGETTMHYDVVIGSTTFSGSARVIVSGPEFRFEQSEITVNAGETVDPGLILNDNGYSFDGPWWHIDNPGVVTVLADGTLYANAPGATYVNCEIDVNGIGYMEIRMLVRVTGEAPAFCLSSDALTLWQESTAQLKIVSNTDETLNEETIRWSTSNENLITVDQEGNLAVHNGDEPDHDQYAAVFCDAETTSGDPVSMVCVVTVPAPSVRINEYQFWDGSWYGMNSGDTLGMWESYTLLDPSLTVDVEVTVDDESIVKYCYDSFYAWPYFRAVSEGVTDAHYTITASNGETYTRSARLLVDQDTTPDSLFLDDNIEPDHSIALCLEDGDHWFDFGFEPAYTAANVFFTSSDENIVIAGGHEPVLHPQNPGHATIYVECPDMPELNTEFNVSVIREANVRLVAADGRTALSPNDSVKLVFETTDGVMWRDSDAVGFEFSPYYDDTLVWVGEDGTLHTRMNHGEEEITVRGVTWFMDRRGVAAEYTFSVDDSQPYFFLSAWEEGNGDHMTLAEGSGFHLYLNTNLAYNPETLIYSSSNPEAIDFYRWDEEEGNFHVHAFGSGEAELTVTIPEHDLTATFPVRSFVPTEIDKHMGIQGGSTVVRVGDEFEMYTIFTDDELEYCSNMDDRHEYTVDNAAIVNSIESIKIANGEEPGDRDWMTFRALAPGQVTITSTATYENYPHLVDVDTMTITVLPALDEEPYFRLTSDGGTADHYTIAVGSGFLLFPETNQAFNPDTVICTSSNPEIADFYAWDGNLWDEEAGCFHVHGYAEGDVQVSVTIPEINMTATFPVKVIIPTGISKHISVQDGRTTANVGDEFEIYDINDNEDWEAHSNFDEIITYESDNPAVLDTIKNIKEANDEDPESHDWMTLRALTPGTATITMTATYRNYPQYVCTDSVTITVLPAGEIVVNGASFEADYLQLSTEAWGFAPTAAEMTVNVDTNAPADQITYTWALEREGVVAIEIPEGSDGSTARFTSIDDVTEGLQVTCRVQVGDVYDQTIYGYIDVYAPTFSASPDQDVYNLTVDETKRMNWTVTGEHLAVLQSTRTYSSNESVAFADSYGMLVAVAPGTAVITREFYYNGVLAGSAQVSVNVTGAAATFTQGVIEIGVGESLPLTEYINLQGVTAITQDWVSADEDVALLSSEGVVYGVAPGRTIVTHVTYATDVQNYQATCEIVVTGDPEDSAFTLSDTRISLFYEKQHQLRAYFNGQDVTDQVDWSMDYINEWAMDLSDTGLLTGRYVKVPLIATAIAEYTAGGRIYTAKCYVEVQPQMISVSGGLFSSSNGILYMTAGDTQYIYDNYCVASDDIEVELRITSDNESVARIDGNYIVAVGAGETDLHYTVTGSNGESYTFPLHVCVDMDKYMPTDFLLPDDSIVLVNDIYVIHPQVQPAYAEYTCSYTSNDTNVCTVDEYGIVTKVNPGRTTVDVTLMGENGFSATKSISVLSLGNVTLAPADGRTILEPGETVQLVFSGEHMWNDDEVLSIDIYNHYGNGIGLTEDGVLTTYQRNYVDTGMNGEYTGQYYIPATIAFEGGQFYSCTYTYTIDYTDRYFYATTGGINTEHLIANPGDTYSIVGYTNENSTAAVSYSYSSTASSVASVDMYGTLNCHSVGSAVITVSAVYSDGTTGQDTLSVTVIPSEDLIVTLEPERRLLHVGETIQAPFSHNGSTTYSLDNFTYSSSNTRVLRCNPPDEYGVLTFTALAPGKADLTISGTYDGYKTASDTVTIYVVATDGNSIIRSAALSSDYMELSNAANGSVPNVLGLWMEIDSNVDPSQFTYTWEIADEGIVSYYYPDENDHAVIHLNTEIGQDENGDAILSPGGETTVSCRVQCGDFFDLTFTAAVKVIDEQNGEIVVGSVQPNEYNIYLSNNELGFAPITTDLWFTVDTNASDDQISYTWEIADPSIAAFYFPDEQNPSLVHMTAEIGQDENGDAILSPGGQTTISCRVQVADVFDYTFELNVFVNTPWFSATAGQDHYNMVLGDKVSPAFYTDYGSIGLINEIILKSSNESVVQTSPYGEIAAVGTGDATVTQEYYINGHFAASASVTVTVTGEYIAFSRDRIELDVDESIALGEYIDKSGIRDTSIILSEYWYSSNEEVALLSTNGYVYGVGPGTALVTHYIYTADKTFSTECLVTVTGTPDNTFELIASKDYIYPEETIQLQALFNGTDVTGDVTWTVEPDWMLSVDENGVVTPADYQVADDLVTIKAEIERNDRPYTALSYITYRGRNISISGSQFGEGRTMDLHVGDRQQILENYSLSSDTMVVTVSITSDDESIARIEDNFIVAVGTGETDLHYTVTSAEGESYTAPLRVRVEMPIPTPTGFDVMTETRVLTGEYPLPVTPTVYPEYAVYDVTYKSNDENIVTVGENGYAEAIHAGRTTIDITVSNADSGYSETKSVNVLVLGDNDKLGEEIYFGPADKHSVLQPGESVQLTFTGSPIWTDDEVETITYYNHYYENGEVVMTEDGLMTVFEDGGRDQMAMVVTLIFKGGSYKDFNYAFTIDEETRYYYADVGHYNEIYIANIGDSYTLQRITNADSEEISSVSFVSDNPTVASVDEDGTIVCRSIGETIIHSTMTFTDGTSLSCETPVQVIPATAQYFTPGTIRRLLHVGESSHVFSIFNIPNTFTPHTEFVSSDPSILSIEYDAENYVSYAYARSPGKVTVTYTCWYAEAELTNTLEFFVLE